MFSRAHWPLKTATLLAEFAIRIFIAGDLQPEIATKNVRYIPVVFVNKGCSIAVLYRCGASATEFASTIDAKERALSRMVKTHEAWAAFSVTVDAFAGPSFSLEQGTCALITNAK